MFFIVFSRFLFDTALRLWQAYAPAYCSLLGLSLDQWGYVISAQAVGSMPVLFAAPLLDWLGVRTVVQLCSLIGATSMAASALLFRAGLPRLTLVALLLALSTSYGFARALYKTTAPVVISRVFGPEERGTAFSLLELGWGFSSFVGLPAIGLLVAVHVRGLPEAALAGLLVLPFALAPAFLPSGDTEPPTVSGMDSRRGSRRSSVDFDYAVLEEKRVEGEARLLGERDDGLVDGPARGTDDAVRLTAGYSRVARGARNGLYLLLCVSTGFGYMFYLTLYSTWLTEKHGLTTDALASATFAAVGAAEMATDILGAVILDRVGVHRSLVLGSILAAVGCALSLFFGGRSLNGDIALVFVVVGTMEYQIIALNTFHTILNDVQELHAYAMMTYVTAFQVGRIFGPLAAGPVWRAYGFEGLSAVTAASFILPATLAVAVGRMRSLETGLTIHEEREHRERSNRE
jgi:MFS family permease